MGAFFSLRGSAEWKKTTSEMAEPSIWSNVRFSPLARGQQVLFDRPGRAEYSFPSGLRQGGDLIWMSDVTDLSLLVGIDESVGHFYCALLLCCPRANAQHKYRRSSEEVVLKTGGTSEAGSLSKSEGVASPSGDASAKPGASTGAEGSMALDQMYNERSDGDAHEMQWPFLLLYAVKEGVICFFSNEREECTAIVRAIAESYSSPEGAAIASLGEGDSMQIKVVDYPVGRCAPPVCRVLSDAIILDLQRRFAINCEPDEQDGCTNCVVFCLRLMTAVQLSMRGYDIQKVCESRSDLGPKAGDAAGAVWEKLLRTVRA